MSDLKQALGSKRARKGGSINLTYNIMKAINNTQKLFTTSQIFGIIVFVALVAVALYMGTKGDWSGFNSVGLGK